MRVRTFFLIAGVMLLVAQVFAQQSVADSTLKAANRLYNSGSYDSAELAARRLEEQGPLADSMRVEAERVIAFSLVAQGKPDLAREHFETILAINPGFQLDQILTSPKILTAFQEAKLHSPEAMRLSRDDHGGGPGGTGVTFRTVVFPGWEQLHRGRTGTGLAFVGGGVLTLGSAVTFEFLRANARRDYLGATAPSDISSKYKVYNKFYQAEVYSFVAYAVVYIASEFDVFLTLSDPTTIHSSAAPPNNKSLTFSLAF